MIGEREPQSGHTLDKDTLNALKRQETIKEAIGGNRDVTTYTWVITTKSPVRNNAILVCRRKNTETNAEAFLITKGSVQDGKPVLPEGRFAFSAFDREEWDAFVEGVSAGEFNFGRDGAVERSKPSDKPTSTKPITDWAAKYWVDEQRILHLPNEVDPTPHDTTPPQAIGAAAVAEITSLDTA